ncbi:hypothetical protein AB0M35_28310 [Micromonospora sp. NPDC051196]|uniref:hypothetical protein n=1 Tax=Micromonospora sp. NPDC051196 TaxID=3155281 RepID=UPI00341D5BE9
MTDAWLKEQQPNPSEGASGASAPRQADPYGQEVLAAVLAELGALSVRLTAQSDTLRTVNKLLAEHDRTLGMLLSAIARVDGTMTGQVLPGIEQIRTSIAEGSTAVLTSVDRTLTRQMASVVDPIDALRAQVAELRGGLARYELDLRDRLADMARNRTDTTTQRHREYGEIGLSFDALYLQRVRPLVANAEPKLRRNRAERWRPGAELVRQILEALFGRAEANLEWIRKELPRQGIPADDSTLWRLLKEALVLRERASSVGLAHEWSFDDRWVPHEPMNRDVWAGCTAEDPIAFVVKPAFVVEGRALTKPIVFTSTIIH